MSNATSIQDFVRDESFTINKRTNRGKHALRLVEQASAEYTVAIGKTSEWDDEGAVHFVLNDAEGTKSAITHYLSTYKPMDPAYRSRQESFALVLEGVWSVASEDWRWVNAVIFQYDPETDTVTEKQDRLRFGGGVLNPAKAVSDKVAEKMAQEARAVARLESIARLKESQPLSDSERWAVDCAQAFVDGFASVEPTDIHRWNPQKARDLSVELVSLNIARAFLAVVGKTTLEVGNECTNNWRNDAERDRVIGVDEAFGKAVAIAVRNDHFVDSVTRDLLGEAVKHFMGEVLRGNYLKNSIL